MSVTASGVISNTEETMKTMLSACSEFQTLCGAGSANQAAERIYTNATPFPSETQDHYNLDELLTLRPFAEVWTSETDGFNYDELRRASGNMKILIEQNTPLADHAACADRLFFNTLGKIIMSGDSSNPGLIELSRAQTYLQINSVSLMEIQRTTKEQYSMLGDAQRAILLVKWS